MTHESKETASVRVDAAQDDFLMAQKTERAAHKWRNAQLTLNVDKDGCHITLAYLKFRLAEGIFSDVSAAN